MARVRWGGSKGRSEGREWEEIKWRSRVKRANSEASPAAWKNSKLSNITFLTFTLFFHLNPCTLKIQDF